MTLRLWSLHPSYLDTRGLVALWREALLAQAVLAGNTKGYRAHPQLERFRGHAAPLEAIAQYLRGVHAEAVRRGYAFDASKIMASPTAQRMPVTQGQLDHEWAHLVAKIAVRDPALHARLEDERHPRPHPLFHIVPGDVASWERTTDDPFEEATT